MSTSRPRTAGASPRAVCSSGADSAYPGGRQVRRLWLEWRRGCGPDGLVLAALCLLALAHGADRRRARTGFRPRMAAHGRGCGRGREHLHSDGPTGQARATCYSDRADRRRGPGPINYGAAVGCVHTDATGATRVTGNPDRPTAHGVREVI